jgi:hypothetical protein
MRHAEHGRALGVSGEKRADGGCRDSMFTVAPRPAETERQRREADRLTQLGRALRELRIGSILTYSPQAKGRIERSFLMAQDRLVKHSRLAKISTLKGRPYVFRNRVPAGVERALRPAGGGISQSPGAERAVESGGGSFARQAPGYQERLHDFFRRPTISDPMFSGAGGNAATTVARGTPAEWRVEGSPSGALCRDRRVRRQADSGAS